MDRIKQRNKLREKEKVAREELIEQQTKTENVNKEVIQAERKLFEADRAVNRFAEVLIIGVNGQIYKYC